MHRGRCFDECPDGFAPLDETMECVEGCEVGHWSEWGTCSRNNRTCGFKWGLETRTRQIVKKPAKDTIPCPTIAESRRCKMAMRHCPGGEFGEFLSCVGCVLSESSSPQSIHPQRKPSNIISD
ncbi:hypothetical protein GH733_008066, partial [Mirounga leonina]